jgi:hypothetical protein
MVGDQRRGGVVEPVAYGYRRPAVDLPWPFQLDPLAFQ